MAKIFYQYKITFREKTWLLKPSLILFDLYKISYFCYLNKK
jgi:hypothetical protein